VLRRAVRIPARPQAVFGLVDLVAFVQQVAKILLDSRVPSGLAGMASRVSRIGRWVEVLQQYSCGFAPKNPPPAPPLLRQ